MLSQQNPHLWARACKRQAVVQMRENRQHNSSECFWGPSFLLSFLQPAFLLAWTPRFMQKIKNRRSFSTQEFPRCHQRLRCSRNTSNSTATKLPSHTIKCSLELIPGRIPGVLGQGHPKGLWLRVTRAGAVGEQRQGPPHPSPNPLRWEGLGEWVCPTQNQGTLRLRRGRRALYVTACLIVCGFCLSQYPNLWLEVWLIGNKLNDAKIPCVEAVLPMAVLPLRFPPGKMGIESASTWLLPWE